MLRVGRGALGRMMSPSCFFKWLVTTFAHSTLYCVGSYVGLWRRPVTSLAPKTRRNQTARGIATALAWSKSSKSWPFAPCGTLFPSLCSGTDGLARSANHACLLASLGVTRWGMRNVDCLRGIICEIHEGNNEQTYGMTTAPARRANTWFIRSSSSATVSISERRRNVSDAPHVSA